VILEDNEPDTLHPLPPTPEVASESTLAPVQLISHHSSQRSQEQQCDDIATRNTPEVLAPQPSTALPEESGGGESGDQGCDLERDLQLAFGEQEELFAVSGKPVYPPIYCALDQGGFEELGSISRTRSQVQGEPAPVEQQQEEVRMDEVRQEAVVAELEVEDGDDGDANGECEQREEEQQQQRNSISSCNGHDTDVEEEEDPRPAKRRRLAPTMPSYFDGLARYGTQPAPVTCTSEHDYLSPTEPVC